ncbi:MAG: YbjN domain-containing protein [Actinobacteria bacterium]|nr:MAG: YbjN domain-containing protein [Actinomycetota bacterium]
MPSSAVDVRAARVVAAWCMDSGVEHERTGPGEFAIVLPGEQKLRSTVSVTVGVNTVVINAFVIRHPDENVGAVHRFLLQRNLSIFGLGYAIDHLGDVFLVGTLPSAGLNADDFDRLMGSVLVNADAVFNQLLELGFASAIRAEWEWRLRAGESTHNLAAFEHLAPQQPTQPE